MIEMSLGQHRGCVARLDVVRLVGWLYVHCGCTGDDRAPDRVLLTWKHCNCDGLWLACNPRLLHSPRGRPCLRLMIHE